MIMSRREVLNALGALGLGAFMSACRDERSRAAPATTSTAQTAVATTIAAGVRPVVRKLDHVFAVVGDVPRALQFMNETLNLPLAWPFADYGLFASGAVNLGNLNLELVDARGQFVAVNPARVTGIAFEPASTVNAAFAEDLDKRGVAHGPQELRGSWTNISFDGLVGADIAVFATDYHVAAFKDAAARRKSLDDVAGGRLGVVGAAELVIGVVDIDAAQRRWQRLLSPAGPGPGRRWTLGSGPAVRLVPHERNEVVDLILQTNSGNAADVLASLRTPSDPLVGLPLTCRPR
jgi:catechol 2,3-dioxygenase-like lactoylglutathione lyase family enzyme